MSLCLLDIPGTKNEYFWQKIDNNNNVKINFFIVKKVLYFRVTLYAFFIIIYIWETIYIFILK